MTRPRSKAGERDEVAIPKRQRRASRSDGLDGLLGLVCHRLDVDALLSETRGPAWHAALDTRKPKRAKRVARKALR